MKKTVRWMISAVCFLAIGLFLFAELSNVMRRKTGEENDMIHSFYNQEKNSLDVLCIGSSHAYAALSPVVLWGEYGITSYVAASPRQTMAMSYYLLKEALQYQQLRVVLLETYYLRYDGKYTDESRLHLSFDGVRMGKAKTEMLDDLLEGASWKEKMNYYLPFLMFHSRWGELKDSDFNTDDYMRGGLQDYKIYPMEDPGLPEKVREVPAVNQEYLEKFRSLCEENDIQLVLFASPYGHKGDLKKYNKMQSYNNWVEQYAEENGIPFLYYQKSGEAAIDFATDFRDWGHLNSKGSEKVTRHLGTYLKEQYGLEDHRQEPGHEEWDADYAKYLEKAAASGG